MLFWLGGKHKKTNTGVRSIGWRFPLELWNPLFWRSKRCLHPENCCTCFATYFVHKHKYYVFFLNDNVDMWYMHISRYIMNHTDNMWHHGFQLAVWIGHHTLLNCKAVEEKCVNHVIITMIQVCWSYAWSCAHMHTYSRMCWQTIYICVWLPARHELQH